VTFHELAAAARETLRAAGVSTATARLDADLLARHALGWDQAHWLAHRDEPADAAFEARYAALVARRTTREPVAQIRGVQEFWTREFTVSPAVLTPRPETELLVEVASAYLATRPTALVVDVGTGSGCIAITLALEHPGVTVHATDISGEALTVARQNAVRLGAMRVQFHEGSYLASVPSPLDLIVSNPPYVAARSAPALAPEVRVYEPSVALFGGDDGLRDVRALLHAAREALADEGRLVFEIGYDQAEHMADEVMRVGDLVVMDIREDLQGIPRVVTVQRR
jgi:release factor glutamine methyltransferase